MKKVFVALLIVLTIGVISTSLAVSKFPDTVGTKYDAAAVQWGGLWRMPTKEEMQELIDSCSWKWSTLIVKGCIVSGNGNHIFLPYTEAMSGRGFLGISSGSYWTDTLNYDEYTGCMSYVWSLIFGSDFKLIEGLIKRIHGHLIRPVLDD